MLASTLLAAAAVSARADIRLDNLGARAPDRILVFVARGEGVRTPVVAFQERARQIIEEHMYARVISMEESFVRGGAELQRQLQECRGDDRCYARLVGAVEAGYLLVVTAAPVGDATIVGARFIDLGAATALGNAVDTVPDGSDVLSVLPSRIQASVPADMWDPFGWLAVSASADGAEITIDGRVVGVTPLDRIGHLLPGSYQVAASKPGHAPASLDVTVERAKEASAALVLPVEESGSSWWLWTIVGAVAAAGAATAVALAVSGGDRVLCSSPDPSACD